MMTNKETSSIPGHKGCICEGFKTFVYFDNVLIIKFLKKYTLGGRVENLRIFKS